MAAGFLRRTTRHDFLLLRQITRKRCISGHCYIQYTLNKWCIVIFIGIILKFCITHEKYSYYTKMCNKMILFNWNELWIPPSEYSSVYVYVHTYVYENKIKFSWTYVKFMMFYWCIIYSNLPETGRMHIYSK